MCFQLFNWLTTSTSLTEPLNTKRGKWYCTESYFYTIFSPSAKDGKLKKGIRVVSFRLFYFILILCIKINVLRGAA
jgi:hypothetical protein